MAFTGPKDLEFTPWDLDVIESRLPLLRSHDAYLRPSPATPLYPRRSRGTDLQAQPLPRPHVSRACQDQESRTGEHDRPASLGHRLGCPLLDRSAKVLPARVDPPDPTRTRRRPCHQDLGGLDRQGHPVLSGHPRGAQQDPDVMREQYAAVDEIILSIDGLQPEKGHETLYVVRELTRRRVWFAEPLISATAGEVRRLIKKAKEWAEALGKAVALWLSDRQDAFVTGIAAEFPDVPHRSCASHFLRDVAKPVLEADSHAKVQMRKKVRGLRTIEQAVLQRRASPGREPSPDADAPAEAEAIPGARRRRTTRLRGPPARMR